MKWLTCTFLILLTCTLTAEDQKSATEFDADAAKAHFKKGVTITVDGDRSFGEVKAGRVYDADRQFVVETKEDGTVTEMPYIVIPILFQLDSTELLDETSQANVLKLAEILNSKEFAKGQFEVEGHTCSDGEEAHNLELSQKRAQAIYTALTQKDVSSGKLSAKGFGETSPAVANDSEANKQQNRRVVVVMKK